MTSLNMSSSVADRYKALGMAFDLFLDNTFSGMVIPDDPLKEVKMSKVDVPKEKAEFDLKQKIFFLDFYFLAENLPDVKVGNTSAFNQLDEAFLSKEVAEVIKWFKIIVNQKSYFDYLRGESKEEIDFRLMNFGNERKLTSLKSEDRDLLVTIKGIPITRSKEISSYPQEIEWECNECGNIVTQVVKTRQKPGKFQRQCMNLIQDDKNTANNFYCKSTNYTQISVNKYLNVFYAQIEALSIDTENKLDPFTFHLEFTDRLCCETYINKFYLGSAYKILGIVKMREIPSKNLDSRFITYLEVMSFQQIENQKSKIEISTEEREDIRKFLVQPDAIDKLTERFGREVVGFAREKKMFILMRLMMERFNKVQDANPKDYIMHSLIVGNYARGKSELAEVFKGICDNPYYIIGSSTSGVGLSGATIRDEMTGTYGIQAGILARASNDFLIIEEYDKAQNKADFGILNQSMASFNFVIAKGGTFRTFKANTGIVIIANPKGKVFDETVSLIPQIDMGGDTLSRFATISCILASKGIEEELNINAIMLNKLSPEIKKQSNEESIYIKKCIKIASESEPYMNTPELKEFLDEFTKKTYILSKQTQGGDQEFYKNVNPRNRNTMIKIIKAVTMMHLHKIPTKEDMKEGFDLQVSFWKEFIEHPSLLNMTEVQSGMTLGQIEEEVKLDMQTANWNMKIEEIKGTKKGNADLIIDKIEALSKISDNQLADVSEVQKWAKEVLFIDDREFDKILERLSFMKEIYFPRAGYAKVF